MGIFNCAHRNRIASFGLRFNSTIIEDTHIPVKIGLSIGKTTILQRFPKEFLV